MANEQFGFVFAISFIIIFAGLLVAVPAGLQGQGATPNIVIPVDPNLFTDFTTTEDYQESDFLAGVGYDYYSYDNFGGYDWEIDYASNTFILGAKVYWGGFLWLGAMDYVEWINSDGTNLGTYITFTDIDTDQVDGSVRYNLIFHTSGADAGGFIFYYNSTAYSDAATAWAADGLYLVHGFGITANTNIASLLVGLLFLQLPDIPVLLNLVIATVIWASVVYILWYIIKEMIPFL